MGSKANPGRYDCYANALPDEPLFVLLARDPDFEEIVRIWALRRQQRIDRGAAPPTDKELVLEALQCAEDGATWRSKAISEHPIPRWRRFRQPKA